MFRKIILAVVVALLIASLAACGEKKKETTPEAVVVDVDEAELDPNEAPTIIDVPAPQDPERLDNDILEELPEAVAESPQDAIGDPAAEDETGASV